LVGAGRGVIKGRDFTVEEETVLAELPFGGPQPGRLIIRVDLLDSEEPARLVTQLGAGGQLPALEQDGDLNYTSGIYEFELARYTANELMLSDFEQTAAMLLPPQFFAAVPASGWSQATASDLWRQTVEVPGVTEDMALVMGLDTRNMQTSADGAAMKAQAKEGAKIMGVASGNGEVAFRTFGAAAGDKPSVNLNLMLKA
jgi:hypothetical protein